MQEGLVGFLAIVQVLVVLARARTVVPTMSRQQSAHSSQLTAHNSIVIIIVLTTTMAAQTQRACHWHF
jgi:hypothetical protein